MTSSLSVILSGTGTWQHRCRLSCTIGQSLPRNDEHITTSPGDLILYQGSNLVIYYATNTYTFTRLGKIDNVTQAELKSALGEGGVKVTLSLE